MTRNTLARIVEAFFSLWLVLVIPVLVSMVVGLGQASQVRAEYTSAGSILVDTDSLLTSRSGVDTGGFFTFLTPAEFVSQEIRGLMATDAFVLKVMETAEIEVPSNPTLAAMELDRVRIAVFAVPNSEQLLRVGATTVNPEASQRIAAALIQEFLEFRIELDVAESRTSEQFFVALVETYGQSLAEAQDAVDRFLLGVSDVDALPAELETEFSRLAAAEAAAAALYGGALEDLEASRLAALQAETDVLQSLSIVDAPPIPQVPAGDLLDRVIIVFSYAFVGVLMSVVAAVLLAVVNRTVLFPQDLAHLTGARVVAVVPRSRKASLRPEDAALPALVDDGRPRPEVVTDGRNGPVENRNGSAGREARARRGKAPVLAGGSSDADDADERERT